MTYQFWLVMFCMWTGWAVFQFITGPVWVSLVLDISMATFCAIMAFRAQRRGRISNES